MSLGSRGPCWREVRNKAKRPGSSVISVCLPVSSRSWAPPALLWAQKVWTDTLHPLFPLDPQFWGSSISILDTFSESKWPVLSGHTQKEHSEVLGSHPRSSSISIWFHKNQRQCCPYLLWRQWIPSVRGRTAEEHRTQRETEKRLLCRKDTSLLDSGKGYFTSQYATICPSHSFS